MTTLETNFSDQHNIQLDLSQLGLTRIHPAFYFYQFTSNFSSSQVDQSKPLTTTNSLVSGTFLNGDTFEVVGKNLSNTSTYTINSFRYISQSSGGITLEANGNYQYRNDQNIQGFSELKVTFNSNANQDVTYEYQGSFFDEATSLITNVKITNGAYSAQMSGNIYFQNSSFLPNSNINTVQLNLNNWSANYIDTQISPDGLGILSTYDKLHITLLTGDDQITGSPDDNVLFAGAGDDILNGLAGADVMYGGTGDDTYFVDHVSDRVIEFAGLQSHIVSTDTSAVPFNTSNYAISQNGKFMAYYGEGQVVDSVYYRSIIIKNLADNTMREINAPTDDIFAESTVLANDGSFVIYEQWFENEIKLFDIKTGKISTVSADRDDIPANGLSQDPVLSADDQFLLFQSEATNLIENDVNDASDIFIKNLQTGVVTLASVDEGGHPLAYKDYEYNRDHVTGTLSADGQYVVFTTTIEPYDVPHVFIKNLETGKIDIVDITKDGDTNPFAFGKPELVKLSDDGRYVTFLSRYDYLNQDFATFKNGIYQKDLITGELTLVTSNAAGVASNNQISDAYYHEYTVSGDGRFVAFFANSSNLVEQASDNLQLFIKDTHSGKVIRLLEYISSSDINMPLFLSMSTDGGTIYAVWEDPGSIYHGDTTYIKEIYNPFIFDPSNNEGNDTIISTVSYQLPDYIEVLTLVGEAAIEGVGNNIDNTLIGNNSNNSLSGGKGNDILIGGLGSDTAIFDITHTEIDYIRPTKKGGIAIASSEGVDTLIDIEQLQFNDGLFAIDTITQSHQYNTPTFLMVNNNLTEMINPEIYDGAVGFLQFQLLGNQSNNIVIGAESNDFINLLGGDDAANGGDGDDVLDGGTGSNFLTGGAGDNTFFLDGRGGSVTWSTITDFHEDEVNIWGWQEGTSQLLAQLESAGAEGYTGATLHYDLNNDGLIDTSITFSGLNLADIPDKSASNVAGNGYLLIS